MSDGVIRVGVSGWTHADWRGGFYPKSLGRAQELRYLAAHFRTVEVNSTFYAAHTPETYAGWANQVAADFAFALRGPRQITHILRLRDAEAALSAFLASGLLWLNLHLGPILWQLPPNLPFDAARFEAFLRLLPTDMQQAAELALRQTKGRLELPQINWNRPFRHAFEARHKSYQCSAFIDLLRRYNAALAFSDGQQAMDITADFVYCRIGGSSLPEALDAAAWAAWARCWARGDDPLDLPHIGRSARRRKRNVFVFFDSSLKARAPTQALELMRRLRA